MKRACTLAVAVCCTVGTTARAQDTGTIEVPLHLDGGRLVVVARAPDGGEYRLAVSTGNGTTVLSESAAARLGENGTLSIGAVPVVTDRMATVPDGDLVADGSTVDGLLGSNTLNQFDVLVDAPGGRLVFQPIGDAVSWEGMTLSDPVRLRVYHGVMLGFDVRFNGREVAGMLDLGTTALVVNPPLQSALDGGLEGSATIGLGDVTLADLPAQVSDLPVFRPWDPEGRGFVIVGAPIAYRCPIAISWVHREMRTCVR